MSEARRLIDDLERRRRKRVFPEDINNAVSEVGMRSSSHVEYADQRNRWLKVAEMLDCTLMDLASAIAKAGYNQNSYENYLTGVEGLWELTQHRGLYKLTDYYTSGTPGSDQLVVSYFYGDGGRREKFKKYASNKPADMANSIAEFLRGTNAKSTGNVVTYDTDKSSADYVDWGMSVDDLVGELLPHGWNIEIKPGPAKSQLVVHGLDFRGAMSRILGS